MNPAQNKYNQSKYKICKAFINLLETKGLTFNLNATFQVNATHNKLTAKIIACISA